MTPLPAAQVCESMFMMQAVCACAGDFCAPQLPARAAGARPASLCSRLPAGHSQSSHSLCESPLSCLLLRACPPAKTTSVCVCSTKALLTGTNGSSSRWSLPCQTLAISTACALEPRHSPCSFSLSRRSLNLLHGASISSFKCHSCSFQRFFLLCR